LVVTLPRPASVLFPNCNLFVTFETLRFRPSASGCGG